VVLGSCGDHVAGTVRQLPFEPGADLIDHLCGFLPAKPQHLAYGEGIEALRGCLDEVVEQGAVVVVLEIRVDRGGNPATDLLMQGDDGVTLAVEVSEGF